MGRDFKGLTEPMTWRLSVHRYDIDNLFDRDPVTHRYYSIGKATIKGVKVTSSFETGPLTHQSG